MTGDGAVVRELVEFLEHGVKVSADVGCHKDVAKFERFIAAIRQQAAEIERLTHHAAEWERLFLAVNAKLKASEACAASQQGEIERLTRDFEISRRAAHLFEDAANVGLDRALNAEARTADLLKALERLRDWADHKPDCASLVEQFYAAHDGTPMLYYDDCTCGLAAAKGETV